jgi:hypothetical protein
MNVTLTFKGTIESAGALEKRLAKLLDLNQRAIDAAKKRGDQATALKLMTVRRKLTVNNLIGVLVQWALPSALDEALLKAIDSEGVRTGRPARAS